MAENLAIRQPVTCWPNEIRGASELLHSTIGRNLDLSVDEVRLALSNIFDNYPELKMAMSITDKMLVHLDTIRDEARLQTMRPDRDSGEGLKNIKQMCGHWGMKHTLYVQAWEWDQWEAQGARHG